jgi:hypothetical protein
MVDRDANGVGEGNSRAMALRDYIDAGTTQKPMISSVKAAGTYG